MENYTDFRVLNQPSTPTINSTDRDVLLTNTLFVYCWVLFASVLLRIFFIYFLDQVHMDHSPTQAYSLGHKTHVSKNLKFFTIKCKSYKMLNYCIN